MLLVHGFAGAITTYYTLNHKRNVKFSPKNLNVIWFLGAIGGIFPDFDIVLPFINREIEHRKLLTHSLIPYLALFLLINVLVALLRLDKEKKEFIKTSNLVFFIGVLSHLFLDYFAGGLQLLSPLTNCYFGYHLPFEATSPYWQFMYFTSYYVVGEIIVTIWFASIFKYIKNVVGRYLPIFFFLVAITATLAFMIF